MTKLRTDNGRRDFIKTIALTTLGFVVLKSCTIDFIDSNCDSPENLIPDPNKYLNLPEGFSYKIISKSGEMMDDGFFVPGRPDGMGTFQGSTQDQVIIVRNHENSPDTLRHSPFGSNNELLQNIDTNKLYDDGGLSMPGLGGTTTLIYNESTGEVEHQHLSLAGTYRNCAGGITPWGSWLTCEEDVTTIGGNTRKDHGFVFEVHSLDTGLVTATPIVEMGRFNHEAMAVDPNTSIVYMTEDRPDGLIYRFIPNVPEQLAQGGRLQVLAIKNKPSLDTRNWDEKTFNVGQTEEVEWLDIDNVLSPADDLRFRGFNNGASRFARGEGIWFGNNELYFACTNGGPEQSGQIFKYQLSPDEGNEVDGSTAGTLELYVQSMGKGILNMCDNLTITPWGDLMVCEDNGERNRILQIKQNGSVVVFACNRRSDSEFAGIVFSPSGNTLFVNIQDNGDTLSITGPWETIT